MKRTTWKQLALVAVVPVFAIGLAVLSPGVANAYSGAIFTTGSTGQTVDQNIYNFKTEVYLDGGPQNTNSSGLPNGTYYFQVTEPDGTLLSTDDAQCRQLTVANNVVSGAAGPCPHANAVTNPANNSTAVQLVPFHDTGNAGGEYKVWLIAQTSDTSIDSGDPRRIVFLNQDSKTDNFKVLATSVPPVGLGGDSISGFKFYDANLNGVQDSGEPGIPGWHIELFGAASSNTTTAITPAGAYLFANLALGTYGVCEVIPANAPVWVNTTPKTITDLTVPSGSSGNNFGNVCLGTGGGLTLGFWSNKNGQALVGSDDLIMLTNLNLRNANGTNFDPTTYSSFRTWILGATATNMAYMLSAQLAAMELNVFNGKVSGTSMVYAGAAPTNCSVANLTAFGFISINNLMNDANASLATDGYTVASGDVRNCQQFLKNTLDNANNDRNFVQSAPCLVNYSGNEPSCAPQQ